MIGKEGGGEVRSVLNAWHGKCIVIVVIIIIIIIIIIINIIIIISSMVIPPCSIATAVYAKEAVSTLNR